LTVKKEIYKKRLRKKIEEERQSEFLKTNLERQIYFGRKNKKKN